MRDYVTMRNVLMLTAAAKGKLCFNDFRGELQDDTGLKKSWSGLKAKSCLMQTSPLTAFLVEGGSAVFRGSRPKVVLSTGLSRTTTYGQ